MADHVYECEVRKTVADSVTGQHTMAWVVVTVNEALKLNDPIRRCMACHGRVRLHRAGPNGQPRAHAEHMRRNSGCPDPCRRRGKWISLVAKDILSAYERRHHGATWATGSRYHSARTYQDRQSHSWAPDPRFHPASMRYGAREDCRSACPAIQRR